MIVYRFIIKQKSVVIYNIKKGRVISAFYFFELIGFA